MKHGLLFLILLINISHASAQSKSSVADSLAYEYTKVSAYKNGELYRSYPIGFRYPRAARDNEIEGVMSFTCYLNEKCEVEKVEYQKSLGPVFEKTIREDLASVCTIFKAYKYENCEQIKFYQELNFRLQ